jgi:hypothetical protein
MARCPECLASIDIRPVAKIVAGGRLNVIGKGFGISCGHCATRCEILQWRPVLLSVLIYVAAVAAPVIFAISSDMASTWNRWEFIAAALVLLSAVALIQRHVIAPLATLRKAHPEGRLNYPLEWDTTHIAKVELEDAFAGSSASVVWQCRSCREQNSGEFEICWKCKRDRQLTGA